MPTSAPSNTVCADCGAHENEMHKPTCSRQGLRVPQKSTRTSCPGCGAPPDAHHASDCALVAAMGRRATGIGGLKIIISVPPEVEQYAPDIGRFVEAMVYKLGVKSHKGKWENMDLQTALRLLRNEEIELTEAVARGNMVEIMLEAADVANFALIASAIAMERK